MTEEQDKILCTKYPKIFANRNGSAEETCMCWGFEVGEGWFNIIDALCESIQSYVDNNHKPQPVAVQVKEKYGTLRFYMDNTDSLIEGMIWLAETISGKTCDICGQPGYCNKEGWISARCDLHRGS